ncbi:uncharacterized protein ISCGN_031751 [Ixodes scapularis]
MTTLSGARRVDLPLYPKRVVNVLDHGRFAASMRLSVPVEAMVAVPAFLAQVGIRTHLSKLLDQDEVGKVFSFLATCDAVLPIAGELMYTAIFNWSISFLPGMPYLFTACITLISVGLLSYCTKVTRDNIAYEEMSKADESVVSVGSTAVNS